MPKVIGKKTNRVPSRLRFYLLRIYLNRLARGSINYVGIPLIFVVLIVLFLGYGSNREDISNWIARYIILVKSKPEFAIRHVDVQGATPLIQQSIYDYIDNFIGTSTVNFDVDRVREAIESNPAITKAAVGVRDGGVIYVSLVEKIPVILWYINNKYFLLDSDGNKLKSISDRSLYPTLYLIVGPGADSNVQEALSIFDVSQSLSQMTRGLVRVGNRRWDVVLDRERTVMLPETDPITALHRIDPLEKSDRILARNLSVIDLRIPGRIVVRTASEPI